MDQIQKQCESEISYYHPVSYTHLDVYKRQQQTYLILLLVVIIYF